MIRKIIQIDEEKCNGCGACAKACHEDAIAIINGKAKLIRDDYCDGLGDCLPTCPTNAISFVEREATAYDEQAVKRNQIAKKMKAQGNFSGGCPGSRIKQIQHTNSSSIPNTTEKTTRLSQWPVQIKLAPVSAPFFEDANLLVAADCTAYAYGDFHEKFIKNRITLIGCPKLDEGDYTEKLTAIISDNNIKSLTIVRMEVPCCGGLENAAKNALQKSGKLIPWQVVTISIDGKILN